MRKFMMKYMMVSCQEATMLMAKKEEGKLSFFGRINLMIHTSMCSICRKFEKQTSEMAHECKHVEGDKNLSESAKERMGKLFETR